MHSVLLAVALRVPPPPPKIRPAADPGLQLVFCGTPEFLLFQQQYAQDSHSPDNTNEGGLKPAMEGLDRSFRHTELSLPFAGGRWFLIMP